MTQKFQNKYRIASARLKDWDYGSNAIYFVTICTQNREHYFGEIIDGKMQLNEIGELVQKYWIEIPNHFPFVQLHEFVVMPNHVHGIIEINRKTADAPQLNGDIVKTPKLGVSTGKWEPCVLGVIINQYKRICTINARKTNPKFAWQSRFHDHIIRDFDSYHRIEQYIQNNPARWKEDEYTSP